MSQILITTTTKNHDHDKLENMEDLLQYLPEHKVIVCSTCRYCIKSNGVELHLQRFHKDVQFKIRKDWCNVVNQRAQSGDLLEPHEVVHPTRTSGPVKELRVVDGFECSTCGFVCGTLGTAQFHARTHGWCVGKETSWKPQHVQVSYYNLFG